MIRAVVLASHLLHSSHSPPQLQHRPAVPVRLHTASARHTVLKVVLVGARRQGRSLLVLTPRLATWRTSLLLVLTVVLWGVVVVERRGAAALYERYSGAPVASSRPACSDVWRCR
jgi:hypothetical protein